MPSSVPVTEGKGQDSANNRHVNVEAKDSDVTNPGCQEGSLCCKRLGMDPLPVPQRKCGLLITGLPLSETSLGNCVSRTMRKKIPDV